MRGTLFVELNGTRTDASHVLPLELGDEFTVATSGGDVTVENPSDWEPGAEIRLVLRSPHEDDERVHDRRRIATDP